VNVTKPQMNFPRDGASLSFTPCFSHTCRNAGYRALKCMADTEGKQWCMAWVFKPPDTWPQKAESAAKSMEEITWRLLNDSSSRFFSSTKHSSCRCESWVKKENKYEEITKMDIW